MTSIGPAGRLFRILQEAQQLGNPKEGGRPALEVWSQLVNGEPSSDRSTGVAAFAAVTGLIAETKTLIRAHPESLKQDLFIGALNDAEGALLSQHVGGQWGSVPSQLTGPIMRSLEFCADTLDRLSAEIDVPTEELDGLRAEIEALVQRVVSSDLEAELKELLVARLEEMRGAVLRYRVGGIGPVAAATHAAIGTAVVVSQQTKATSARAVINDYLALAKLSMDIADKAYHFAPVIGNAVAKVVGLLTGGSGPDAA